MEPNMIGAYGPWAAGLVGEGPARLSFREAGMFPPAEIECLAAAEARRRLRDCLLQPHTGGVARKPRSSMSLSTTGSTSST